MEKTKPAATSSSLKDTISQTTAELLKELKEMELSPMEKIALLQTLLPYSVGKLPSVLVADNIAVALDNGKAVSGEANTIKSSPILTPVEGGTNAEKGGTNAEKGGTNAEKGGTNAEC